MYIYIFYFYFVVFKPLTGKYFTFHWNVSSSSYSNDRNYILEYLEILKFTIENS